MSALCHFVDVSDLTPYEKRCSSTELIEVTGAEFESVSSLIRGRVQLSEVNSVSMRAF